jgi:hypothetical protein
MEHKISGAIGQPAACMIENNAGPLSGQLFATAIMA